MNQKQKKISVISLFSGAMGLDLGLEKAGFHIAVAVEVNKYAIETIKRNRPDIPLIDKNIEEVTTQEILEKAGLMPGEPCIVVGGPSCQSFSTAGQRGSVSDPRGSMISQFIRVVKEVNPRFFIMENVKGILSAAIKHRPLKKRGPGNPPLKPEESLGSAFVQITKELQSTEYHIVFDVLNAADYGVPQARERAIFIGSRDGEYVSMPEPTNAKEPNENLPLRVTLGEAIKGLKKASHEYHELSPNRLKYLKMVPHGGNWRDLPEKYKRKLLVVRISLGVAV